MRVLLVFSLFATVIAIAPPAEGQDKKERPKAKSWAEVADAAVAGLKADQAEDGSWSKATHPGITGVVISGVLKSGRANATDPMVAKGLKYVASMVDPKDGSIAAGENIRHKFYTTSVNLQALALSKDKQYDAAVKNAVAYFQKGQVGVDDGKPQSDVNYGGFGYSPGSRGDLSNTHMALDALVAAGVAKDDATFKRAAVFASRMQNFKSEHNDQPWAGAINDGSFIYVAAGGGPMGATAPPADAPRPGYGSMTYAGLKTLAWGGVGRDDPRMKKGLEWISKNYSVDLNPGRPEGNGGQGYFYYLASMAKALDALGIDAVVDANGKSHDWRADILRALATRQRADGRWGNDTRTWMESDPNLDTAYALITLGYVQPK